MWPQPVTRMRHHCSINQTFELKNEKVIGPSQGNKKIVNDKMDGFAVESLMHDSCRRNYCMISV